MDSPKTIKTSNKLIIEKSPYLLQHAYNPVNWYPWGEEAFELAKKENKPIFLSFGYSTCHWCHVMEHESFEDEEVARLMNECFVCMKVDREERPDIDNVYMAVCQLMTGSGGWPLTIFMMPDKRPFFAGTYFPKESKYGRIGMLDLLPSINEIWTKRNHEVLETANEIVNFLKQISSMKSDKELGESAFKLAFEQLSSHFDEEYGGFGRAPKFPTPHNLLFLLRYWKRTGDKKALQMVEKTLQAMQCGGIYDHIGFGFHRYSTDSKWFVPHFEKMLYDQAMLGMAYTETFQATKNEQYKKTAEEIFTYVLRDMTSSEGGFYSAEDADSEEEEGKFYVWTEKEIRQVLEKGEADLAVKIFNMEKSGNYLEEATREKTGTNILYLKCSIEENQKEKIEIIRQKLFKVREKRVHPYKDDKVLVSWNGLMIAALSKAGSAFNNEQYSNAAKHATDFILRYLYKDGKLLHRFRDGEASIQAHVDDYAFFIWGLLELYEVTFETKYLQIALDLNDCSLKHLWDEENFGFYFTSDKDESLIVRQKEIYDGAIPSANSVSMLNLLRLSRITGSSKFEEYATKIRNIFSQSFLQSPTSHTQFLVALDFAIGPSYEVIIVGNPQSEDTEKMLKALNEKFVPNKIVLLKTIEKSPKITGVAGYIESYVSLNGKTTAYVCRNQSCKPPTVDIDKMILYLDAN